MSEKILSGYKKTEIGIIPEDWEVITTEQFCESITDGTHDTPKHVKRGIPLITSKNITNGKINLDEIYYISEKDAKLINKRSYIKDNTLLFSMIGTIGDMAIIEKKEFEFSVKNEVYLD